MPIPPVPGEVYLPLPLQQAPHVAPTQRVLGYLVPRLLLYVPANIQYFTFWDLRKNTRNLQFLLYVLANMQYSVLGDFALLGIPFENYVFLANENIQNPSAFYSIIELSGGQNSGP